MVRSGSGKDREARSTLYFWMARLVAMVPEIYDGKAQLRTLQRRVKAWRSARVTEMVLGGLRKVDAAPAEV